MDFREVRIKRAENGWVITAVGDSTEEHEAYEITVADDSIPISPAQLEQQWVTFIRVLKAVAKDIGPNFDDCPYSANIKLSRPPKQQQ
jgi:hypothetical protein